MLKSNEDKSCHVQKKVFVRASVHPKTYFVSGFVLACHYVWNNYANHNFGNFTLCFLSHFECIKLPFVDFV